MHNVLCDKSNKKKWSYDARHTSVYGRVEARGAMDQGSVRSNERRIEYQSAQQKIRRDDQTNGSPPLSIPVPPNARNWPKRQLVVCVDFRRK